MMQHIGARPHPNCACAPLIGTKAQNRVLRLVGGGAARQRSTLIRREKGTGMMERTMAMRVTNLRDLSDCVRGVTLVAADGAPLAPVTAGAHIDLHIPTPMPIIRQYSLTNAPGARDAYEIAVLREPRSRGGSAYIHSDLAIGDVLGVAGPRNHFAPFEGAPQSVLIAGGIGIAPIRSIALRLQAMGAPFSLHYAARSRASAAFADDLPGPSVATCFADEADLRLDLAALAARTDLRAHVYCCGPARMIDAFERAFASFPSEQRHRELFEAVHPPATGGGFEITLARSGRTLRVTPGETILEVARGAGAGVSFSCAEGVCGMCETRVLEGCPDHRDSVLTDAEQAAGDTMMICCSGSKSARLVLDL